MKRVGNRPAQLVRSASRRGKVPSRFQFDITVENVYGTKAGASYLVKWSRGVKVASTKPTVCAKQHAGSAGLPINQKLSLLVTLYRDENNKFDPKDSKISLIAISSSKKQQRTLAKLHFDLSSYAGVPSASVTKVLKLSDRVSLRATIESRFVKAGTSGPGSAGASSALSAISGVSARSSDDDDTQDQLDDFDDLALEDVPTPDDISNFNSAAQSSKKPGVPNISSSRNFPTSSKSVPSSATTSKPGITGRHSSSPRSSSVAPNIPQNSTAKPNISLPVEASNSSSTPFAEARKKTASTLPHGPPSPKRSSSPVHRPRRERPSAVRPDDIAALARAEEEEKNARILKENERLTSDLTRSKNERKSLELAHKRQIDKLNSQLELRSKGASAASAYRASVDAQVAELTVKNKELHESMRKLTSELETSKRECEELRLQSSRLSASEEKCRSLSREVDKLTVAAAASKSLPDGDSSATSNIEERIAALRKEKEALELKVKAHESHSAKVKTSYQRLSEMYNKLGKDHTELEQQIHELKAERAASVQNQSPSSIANDQTTSLAESLEEAQREIHDIEMSKESLQSDHDRLLSQINVLNDKVESTSRELVEARREANELLSETEELKGQRDMAMQRALSKGKNSANANAESTRSLVKAEEDLQLSKEKYERERVSLVRRAEELEAEVSDLKEDVEYEKAEKSKAREERDHLRESARTMERKQSLAARQNDDMISLRRKVSTHQMREKDHEAMIVDLRSEISRLTKLLEESNDDKRSRHSSNIDDMDEVVQNLVSSKLKLAEAESDKLDLQFSMKQLRKNEKLIQQRLAEHASRLEVKLGQANEELDKLRKDQRCDPASEFNELGSDVDY